MYTTHAYIRVKYQQIRHEKQMPNNYICSYDLSPVEFVDFVQIACKFINQPSERRKSEGKKEKLNKYRAPPQGYCGGPPTNVAVISIITIIIIEQ